MRGYGGIENVFSSTFYGKISSPSTALYGKWWQLPGETFSGMNFPSSVLLITTVSAMKKKGGMGILWLLWWVYITPERWKIVFRWLFLDTEQRGSSDDDMHPLTKRWQGFVRRSICIPHDACNKLWHQQVQMITRREGLLFWKWVPFSSKTNIRD